MGWMHPLSNISFNFIFNSTSLGVLMRYEAFTYGTVPIINSMVKSISLFDGNPSISFGNTSLIYFNTSWLSNLTPLLYNSLVTWIAYEAQYFLLHCFSCSVVIDLSMICFFIPCIVISSPIISLLDFLVTLLLNIYIMNFTQKQQETSQKMPTIKNNSRNYINATFTVYIYCRNIPTNPNGSNLSLIIY